VFRQKGNIIRQHLSKKEATILIGARQVGKSTLLKQLAAELQKEGNDVVFLNLERKDILTDLNENPENIFRYFPQNSPKSYAFIDEVQYLSDPTNFLKLLYDEHSDKLKIVATGRDLNLKDSLVGRKKIFELHTLSFEEFIQFKQR